MMNKFNKFLVYVLSITTISYGIQIEDIINDKYQRSLSIKKYQEVKALTFGKDKSITNINLSNLNFNYQYNLINFVPIKKKSDKFSLSKIYTNVKVDSKIWNEAGFHWSFPLSLLMKGNTLSNNLIQVNIENIKENIYWDETFKKDLWFLNKFGEDEAVYRGHYHWAEFLKTLKQKTTIYSDINSENVEDIEALTNAFEGKSSSDELLSFVSKHLVPRSSGTHYLGYDDDYLNNLDRETSYNFVYRTIDQHGNRLYFTLNNDNKPYTSECTTLGSCDFDDDLINLKKISSDIYVYDNFGNKYIYNKKGLLISYEVLSTDYIVNFSYQPINNGQYLLTNVTDSYGRTATINYPEKLGEGTTTITYGDGRTVSYNSSYISSDMNSPTGINYIRYDLDSREIKKEYPRRFDNSWWSGVEKYIKSKDDIITSFYSNQDDGVIYFLLKNATYLKYDLKDRKVDPGYPKSINEFGNGSLNAYWDKIKVATYGSQKGGKIHVFLNNGQYLRLDANNNEMDAGYPKAISEKWPALDGYNINDVKTAFYSDHGNGYIYFFLNNGQYIRSDLNGKQNGSYPREINDNLWPGVSKYFHGILQSFYSNQYDGNVYFLIDENQYSKVTSFTNENGQTTCLHYAKDKSLISRIEYPSGIIEKIEYSEEKKSSGYAKQEQDENGIDKVYKIYPVTRSTLQVNSDNYPDLSTRYKIENIWHVPLMQDNVLSYSYSGNAMSESGKSNATVKWIKLGFVDDVFVRTFTSITAQTGDLSQDQYIYRPEHFSELNLLGTEGGYTARKNIAHIIRSAHDPKLIYDAYNYYTYNYDAPYDSLKSNPLVEEKDARFPVYRYHYYDGMYVLDNVIDSVQRSDDKTANREIINNYLDKKYINQNDISSKTGEDRNSNEKFILYNADYNYQNHINSLKKDKDYIEKKEAINIKRKYDNASDQNILTTEIITSGTNIENQIEHKHKIESLQDGLSQTITSFGKKMRDKDKTISVLRYNQGTDENNHQKTLDYENSYTQYNDGSKKSMQSILKSELGNKKAQEIINYSKNTDHNYEFNEDEHTVIIKSLDGAEEKRDLYTFDILKEKHKIEGQIVTFEYQYDQFGQLSSITKNKQLKESLYYYLSDKRFDDKDYKNLNTVTIVYDSGDEISIYYDKFGREIAKVENSIDQPQEKEHIIFVKIRDKYGRIIKLIDQFGHPTQYKYDEFNRVIEITDSSGHVLTKEYGLLDKTETTYLNETLQSKIYFDGADRAIRKELFNTASDDIDHMKNGDSVQIIEYHYDALGRIHKKVFKEGLISNPIPDQNQLFHIKNSEINFKYLHDGHVFYDYDLNNAIKTKKHYNYDHEKQEMTVNIEKIYRNEFNKIYKRELLKGFSPLLQEIQGDEKDIKKYTLHNIISYTYNDHLRLENIKVTDLLSNTSVQSEAYGYNENNKITTTCDQLSHCKFYQYNSDGQLTSYTDEFNYSMCYYTIMI